MQLVTTMRFHMHTLRFVG